MEGLGCCERAKRVSLFGVCKNSVCDCNVVLVCIYLVIILLNSSTYFNKFKFFKIFNNRLFDSVRNRLLKCPV